MMLCISVNRLGNIRDDNDPNMTYEGDNNVILQQTSNYILGQMYTKKKGQCRIILSCYNINYDNTSVNFCINYK